MGVKSAAIDALISALLAARAREDFVAAVRALDRVLMSGLHCVPLFHLPEQWIARWPAIERPRETPLYGPLIETWWRTGAATNRVSP
jgi:peptide/nickel transport system substrate-binding protein